MLGHQHARPHRLVAHRDPGLPRRVEVNVPRLRAEALDEAQVAPGGDQLGINAADSLCDEDFHLRQELQDFVARRIAPDGDLQFGRRRFEGGLLVTLAALGEEQHAMTGHMIP